MQNIIMNKTRWIRRGGGGGGDVGAAGLRTYKVQLQWFMENNLRI